MVQTLHYYWQNVAVDDKQRRMCSGPGVKFEDLRDTLGDLFKMIVVLIRTVIDMPTKAAFSTR